MAHTRVYPDLTEWEDYKGKDGLPTSILLGHMRVSFCSTACWKGGVQCLPGKEVDSCGIIYRSIRSSAPGVACVIASLF